MRLPSLSIPAAVLSLAFTACVNNGGPLSSSNPAGTGPFDSRGNYVEAWADSPSQWRKGSTQIVEAVPDRPAAEVPVRPEPVIVANTTPRPVPSNSISGSTTVVYKKPASRTSEASSTVKPKTTVKSTTKPKPKTVVKAKPKTSRYTVRQGDSLYAIAKRNGTTIGALQKANGIKGAMIKPGQSVVIPR